MPPEAWFTDIAEYIFPAFPVVCSERDVMGLTVMSLSLHSLWSALALTVTLTVSTASLQLCRMASGYFFQHEFSRLLNHTYK